METEWRRRSDFAEVAEALGVPTSDVMAAWLPDLEREGVYGVLYTEGTDDLSTAVARRATLERDSSGVLQVITDDALGPLADFIDPA